MTAIQAIETTYEKLAVVYNKPDHPFWSKVGNFCSIFLAPAGVAVIEIFVPAPYKKIVAVVWATAMGAIKGGTKLTVDPKVSKSN